MTDYQIDLDEIIPPGSSWIETIRNQQILRITDLHGQQGVDFLCYNADNVSERYHAPNTIKANGNIYLSEGTTLYSDYANPLMKIISDSTFGQHDTLAGCCSSWSNQMLYGVADVPGCRENFLDALEDYNMGWKDIVPNINFFCSVPIHKNGNMAESVFVAGSSVAGDFVELIAQMNVLSVISNCPQVNNPCNNSNPTDIQVQILSLA